MSEWLRNLSPVEETTTAEDNIVAESTGVLVGLAPLLPAEKLTTTPELQAPAQTEALQEAARTFQAVSTQPPKPAKKPVPPTRRDRMLGQTARITLFVLFILLLTLPLISGLQKTNPTTGQNVPWSEPAGAFGDVLDKQRREMISSQLGAIDLQPPGAVALVSFDYSTATQGEMQPLAEAMLSRLRGQGMRLILISLTPEGAALAQDTLDKILEKRGETYGAETVNLGYMPGEVIGIRELATGRQQLAQIADYEQGLTFAAPERAAWADVNNLAQVGLVVTLADNPATAQRWIEQLGTAIPATSGERYLLAATSAAADTF
jgi:hypothetical protein